jgi:alpha-glucoside transport system substrate-binding protein
VNLYPADCRNTTGKSDANHVVVAAVWAGTEREKFTQVLESFSKENDIDVTFATNTDNADRNIGETLDAFLKQNCPPDVALLPQPGLLRRLASSGDLVPVDDVTGQLVKENYSEAWQAAAMVDGTSYGVWFKAANKSLIWYDVEAFKRAGITDPPRTWEELKTAATMLERVGITPFSVGGKDGWTLTDWFENVYLRMYPDLYQQLSDHRISWTDPSVHDALSKLAEIFGQPGWVAERPLETTYEQSVHQVFGPGQRKAAMVFEGDFVATEIGGSGSVLGVDAKYFDFPQIGNSSAPIVGASSRASEGTAIAGDVAVLMRNTPAGQRLLQFLATPEAAQPWARAGGFRSPNLKVKDPLALSSTGAIAAVSQVNFDLSDLQCPAFGVGKDAAMGPILQSFLGDPGSVAATARRLEEAWLPPPGVTSPDGRGPCP